VTAISIDNPLTSTARHKILLQVCIVEEKYLIRKLLEERKTSSQNKIQKTRNHGRGKIN
jgi:hypothetical protein